MYAVIRDGSVQLRVAQGDVVELERTGLTVGATYSFDVLAVNRDGKTTFGAPTVQGASVVAEVLGEKRGPKIVVQRFRRRKGQQRRLGHRTRVRITEIKA